MAILSGIYMAPASATSAPSVDMFWADVSRTNQTSVTFYLMTNVTVKNIEASDFSVIGSATGCTIDETFSQSSFHVVSLRNCSDGNAAVQLGANSISDLSLNWGPATAAVSDFVTIDSTAPEFTFDLSPATVADGAFTLTAQSSELVSLVDATLTPLISGVACSLTGINVVAQTYTFAIAGCQSGADVQITIQANSYRDATGNLGPTQSVVSAAVRVQPVMAPLPLPLPLPLPTQSTQPTPEPTPTVAPTATPEPTVVAVAPLEPPAPPVPTLELAPTSEPEVELTAEIEPLVPWSPTRGVEPTIQVDFKPEPAKQRHIDAPAFEISADPLPVNARVEAEPAVVEAQASEASLNWMAVLLTLLAAGLATIGGLLVMRKRVAREPRLRIV